MTWRFAHTETTSASPGRVWEHYANPATWPVWDHDTESVAVEGPMAVGVRGRLKPKGGPATSFVFTRVEPGHRFTNVARLPLAEVEFDHRLDPADSGSSITHTITVTGPLAPLFARVVGRRAAAQLPAVMRELARLAER